ncbi:MAG: hypothetical protein KDI82_02240 [Gammaproteobacteria bacterium]|nr:hypothetical protein [Gammaproteobacteria bacterium]
MTTTTTSSGSGWFSKLVVVLLLALAIGLYLRIVMVEGSPQYSAPAHQASVRVVEGNESALAARPMRELPADQMQLIMQTFAAGE